MSFTGDIVIGLEVHAELATRTKLFCACPRTDEGVVAPNARTCPVCLGHPGTRPVLSKRAVEHALKVCLALDCAIADRIVFSRKSYFYPDMSKNFQITQFEEPIGKHGGIKLKSGKRVEMMRVHIEEDPAAITYPDTMAASAYSLIDYNRSGNPLVEIVTMPVIASPAEAREFLNHLARILAYLGVHDDSCILKADANISLRESGYTRVEIKNISGFKEIERALNYEITRQRALLRRGLAIKRETRGWNEGSGTTMSMRSKESEEDYGYIIEPDLPFVMTAGLIGPARENIPELPHEKVTRYIGLGVDPTDAEVMVSEQPLAILFEEVAASVEPAFVAKWLRRELLRVLNYAKLTVRQSRITAGELIELLRLMEEGSISESTAQRMMETLVQTPLSVRAYVQEQGLSIVRDDGALRKACEQVIAEHAQAVADFRAGEEKSFHYLLGQVMRLTRGKADPQRTRSLLEELLKT